MPRGQAGVCTAGSVARWRRGKESEREGRERERVSTDRREEGSRRQRERGGIYKDSGESCEEAESEGEGEKEVPI